ncbi:uncharacterized protein il12rb1 isoform X2 [Betta splendens]|uniref:Uncharacterized protein il12rb1 isoform X2 n=1 Tax=Betta splendens TaxID=158456 RepID=A0A9W2XR55_BETSP|nr:uncharacterized protein il12rb1 isoform X2 [Betta splendens]
MNIFLDFPRCFTETLTRWTSCYVVMFMFLTVSKGSACQAPSSPQCFRTIDTASVYICEWNMMTANNVTFDIYFDNKPFKAFEKTWCHINEELLIKFRPVDIWVRAYVGNSSCDSPRTTVVLGHTVKYDAPQNISLSWSKNDLMLRWRAADIHPAFVEVLFRRREHPSEPWQNRSTTTTNGTFLYQVIVMDLQSDTVYVVRIRQQSSKAQNPLWSAWSQDVIVPAEPKVEPKVAMKTSLLNGYRSVKLSWKPMLHAAGVPGVTYRLTDTQSSCGCPCMKREPFETEQHSYDMFVSYSAVNISVTAINAAGRSPPATVQLPARAADSEACNKTLLQNLNKKSCHEWYELLEEGPRLENVITLTRKKTPEQRKELMNTPDREPHAFKALSQTPTSASMWWRPIPLVNQRGHVTHYNVCSIQISPQNKSKDCFNVSTSLLNFTLNNLTSGAKYIISVAGVTRAGEGPAAAATVTVMLPENTGNVWWSFGLLLVFFLISMLCTVVLKRIKNKIFPPVPMPVIPDFKPCQPETQEMLEEKEEVHELNLEQLPPEDRRWDEGMDGHVEDERGDSRMSGEDSDESTGSLDGSQSSRTEGDLTDLEQIENQIVMLIYRNGLVFDLKTDSS